MAMSCDAEGRLAGEGESSALTTALASLLTCSVPMLSVATVSVATVSVPMVSVHVVRVAMVTWPC